MARIYVGRLQDGETMVDVLLWDANGAPPPGAFADGLTGPRPDAAAHERFELASHLEQLGCALDEDVDDYLCDLIERSWDERTMRH